MENSEIEPKNDKDQIKVKIRTIDNEFQVEISSQDKIENLKQKIQTIAKVPINRQRLIFHGKLLKNEETLCLCKITNEDVVHLVAKIGNIIPHQEEPQNSNVPQNVFLPSPLPYLISNRNPLSRRSFSSSSSNILQHRRRLRNEQLSVNFNGIECKETIAQNIVQINNMIDCGQFKEDEYNNMDIDSERKDNIFYNLENRELVKGQWVDVKDTVDQWLEAQVIDVNEDKREVYIHYNGWGTRWDEWIPMNSKRIMPFRFHTKEEIITNYHSPFPNSKPDANVSLLTSEHKNKTTNELKGDFVEFLNKIKSFNNISTELIDNIIYNRNSLNSNISKPKEQVQLESMNTYKKIIPFFDKFGRLYSDSGAYLNHLFSNSKFEEVDQCMFQNAINTNELLKPYSEEEKKKVKEEMLNNYSQRERDSGTLHFVPPVNKYERNIVNQIPLIDTPLTVKKRSAINHPTIDIYFQTIVTAPHLEDNRRGERVGNSNGENNTTGNNTVINISGDNNSNNSQREGNNNDNNNNDQNNSNDDKEESDIEIRDVDDTLLGKKRKFDDDKEE